MAKLTRRQAECLALKAQGMRAKDIARVLVVSPRTVESHLQYARNRTGKSTVELAILVANQE